MICKMFTVVLLTSVAAVGSSQTVTVNKAGSGGAYTSVGAALSSFASDSNPAENVINITDAGNYEEVFNINVPVTLQATGTSATLIVRSNGAGQFENGGIVVNLPSSITTGSVTLRNLKIIPALDTNSLRLKSAIENGNNNLFLCLDNVMIAPNAGNNTPLDTQGGFNSRVYETYASGKATYDPNIVLFGSHGVVLGRTDTGYTEGAGVELLLKDSVLTHFRDDLVEPAPKPACYAVFMNNSFTAGLTPPAPEFRLTRVEGKTVISCAQRGLSVAGDLDMQSNSRIYVRQCSPEGIRLAGPASSKRTIGDTVIAGCTTGLYDEGYGAIRPTFVHSILYYITNNVVIIKKPSTDVADGLVTFDRCTVVGGKANNGSHTVRIEPSTKCDLLIKDSVMAGKLNASTGAANVISLAGETIATCSGAAVTTAGIFSLRATDPFSRSTFAVVPDKATYITADPQFTGYDPMVTNEDSFLPGFLPESADLLNVQNPAYRFASSTGGALGGGALYVGPDSQVGNWQLY